MSGINTRRAQVNLSGKIAVITGAGSELGLALALLAAHRGMKVALVYDGPVPAPIEKGQKVGMLKITAPDYPEMDAPLYAAESVSRAGIFARMYLGLRTLIFGRSG